MSFKKYLLEMQTSPLDDLYIIELLDVVNFNCVTTFFASWVIDEVSTPVITTITAEYTLNSNDATIPIEFQGIKSVHKDEYTDIRDLTLSLSIDTINDNLELLQDENLFNLVQTKLNSIIKSNSFNKKIYNILISHIDNITKSYSDHMN